MASVEVTGASTTPMLVGGTLQLSAAPKDAAGNVLGDRAVTWRSSDASVAQVSATGSVTAVEIGHATITATSEGKEGSAPIQVRVGGNVTPTGGTLDLVGGALVLETPAGAVSQSVPVTMGRPGGTPISERIVPGTVFDVGPATLALATAAHLSLRYEQSVLPPGSAEESLELHRVENGRWLPVPSTVSLPTRLVRGAITKGGIYAILHRPWTRGEAVPELRSRRVRVGLGGSAASHAGQKLRSRRVPTGLGGSAAAAAANPPQPPAPLGGRGAFVASAKHKPPTHPMSATSGAFAAAGQPPGSRRAAAGQPLGRRCEPSSCWTRFLNRSHTCSDRPSAPSALPHRASWHGGMGPVYLAERE